MSTTDKFSASDSVIKPKFSLRVSKMDVYAENAIKKSNVRAFVNQNRGSNQKDIFDNKQNNNLSLHLLQLKHSNSKIHHNINHKNTDSIKLKDEIQYTTEKVKILQNQRDVLQDKIKKLTDDLFKVSEKKQTAYYAFKSYENILWRMKKDEIHNQIKTNGLEKKLNDIQKEYKEMEKKLYSVTGFEELCEKGLDQAKEEKEKLSLRRSRNIVDISYSLEERKVNEMKKLERLNQTLSIQEMAAGDLQDADLNRMKKFLNAQVFLKCLLKDKMTRLKQFYEPYELAFFKIKSETVVKQAGSLKFQFFNFESNFQEQTVWIKNLQDEIASLEVQRKTLKEQLTSLQEYEFDLCSKHEKETPPNNLNQVSEEQIQKRVIQEQYIKAQVTMMKMKQWVDLQTKRIDKKSQTESSVNAKTEEFNFLCRYLLSYKNVKDGRCEGQINKVQKEPQSKQQQFLLLQQPQQQQQQEQPQSPQNQLQK